MTNSDNCWINIKESDTVIIFIHGLLSSSKECWSGRNKSYWPAMIAADPIFHNVSTFVASYQTSISSGAYDIDQCATAILNELRIRPAPQKTPISHKNIIFVCHSLGGIVARRMLEQHREYFSNKNIGLVLIASPSLGSTYAKTFKRIIKIYGHKIASQLEVNSEALRDLDNRFRSLIQRNPFLTFTGAEACENHGPVWFRYIPFRTRPIVMENSGSRYFGGVTIIPGTDHSSIVKPDTLDHPSHKFLQVYFHDNFSDKITPKVATNVNILPSSSSLEIKPDPLFDLYSKYHREVYVERNTDSELNKAMKTGSAWIYGPTGTGKTTLAKRWLTENNYKPIEITLSQIDSNGDKDSLFQEVSQHIEASGHDIGRGGYIGCIDPLAALSKITAVPLFIDEVPLSDSVAQDALPSAISSLLDGVKRKIGGETKFIICSIKRPSAKQTTERMREQFSMLPQQVWTEDELLRLINIIISNLKISISDESVRVLLNASQGSPRFIKIFFRRNYGQNSISDEQTSIGIRETQQVIRGQI